MTTELSAIARETHEKAVAYFKVAEQYGYKFIMEIKEIRDKQYYKALGFSSFDEYCEKSWKTIRKYMDERIQIAEAFGNEWNFESTYSQLGHSKSLILARMEPERRQEIMSKPQQLPDGSEKTVNEMTVNQLKELERRAKEAEERAAKAENEARHWQGVARSAQNQPPRVITNTIEKIPDHIKKKMEEDEFKLRNLKAGLDEALKELEKYKLKDTVEFDEVQSQLQKKKLQHEADMETLQLSIVYKQFIEKAAIGTYQLGALAVADPAEKQRLLERIEIAQKILNDTKAALQGRKLGGVINE